MAVALLIAGVDAGDFDGAVELELALGRVDRAFELLERAANGRDPHVADLKADVRM